MWTFSIHENLYLWQNSISWWVLGSSWLLRIHRYEWYWPRNPAYDQLLETPLFVCVASINITISYRTHFHYFWPWISLKSSIFGIWFDLDLLIKGTLFANESVAWLWLTWCLTFCFICRIFVADKILLLLSVTLYLHFATSVIHEITTALGINCFRWVKFLVRDPWKYFNLAMWFSGLLILSWFEIFRFSVSAGSLEFLFWVLVLW